MRRDRQYMHRRAQKAEAALKRVVFWLESIERDSDNYASWRARHALEAIEKAHIGGCDVGEMANRKACQYARRGVSWKTAWEWGYREARQEREGRLRSFLRRLVGSM